MTSQDTDLFGPSPIPDDLRKVWLKRGLPDDLIHRAAELHAFGILRGFLRWGGNDDTYVRKRLDWHERLIRRNTCALPSLSRK